ncbi:uncharacterized protein LOC134705126 [Mytilus trossulus]|uniref:uncharacterized protein LOC134705126 n=1 Tax=Mytilus trossulus TaxID=6551 RepID=UPI003007DD84
MNNTIIAFGLEQALNTSTIHDYSIDNFHNITIEVKNNTLGIVILCTCIVIAFLSVFLYCYFRKGPSESFDVSCSFESDRANGATLSMTTSGPGRVMVNYQKNHPNHVNDPESCVETEHL